MNFYLKGALRGTTAHPGRTDTVFDLVILKAKIIRPSYVQLLANTYKVLSLVSNILEKCIDLIGLITKRSFDSTECSFCGVNRSFDSAKRSFGGTNCSFGAVKRSFDSTNRSFDGTKRSFDSTKRSYGAAKRLFRGVKRSFDRTNRSFEATE